MRRRYIAAPVLVGCRRDANGNPLTIFPGPILDIEAFCRTIYTEVMNDWGMFGTHEEREDAIQDLIERALKLEQRYDPERSSNFARYARYILTRRVTDVAPRQWLGRTGNRIAERSHAPLTEFTPRTAQPGRAFANLESDDDLARGEPANGNTAERTSRIAWAVSILAAEATR